MLDFKFDVQEWLFVFICWWFVVVCGHLLVVCDCLWMPVLVTMVIYNEHKGHKNEKRNKENKKYFLDSQTNEDFVTIHH